MEVGIIPDEAKQKFIDVFMGQRGPMRRRGWRCEWVYNGEVIRTFKVKLVRDGLDLWSREPFPVVETGPGALMVTIFDGEGDPFWTYATKNRWGSITVDIPRRFFSLS